MLANLFFVFAYAKQNWHGQTMLWATLHWEFQFDIAVSAVNGPFFCRMGLHGT